ncbi:MAG: phage major capsid protein [Gammaproteobacteria bacterium]|nr:phage major capsid protein [Gammaproteobacteria bacterium]
MKNALEELRDVIKEEVGIQITKQGGGSIPENLGEIVAGEVDTYLKTMGDRSKTNSHLRNTGELKITKDEKQNRYQIELLQEKQITQFDSVPGHNEIGLTPWFSLGKGNPFAPLVSSFEIDGAGAFKVVKVSGASFEKRAKTTDALTAQGELTADDVPVNEFNLKIAGTKSAIEDVPGLPRAAQDYIIDRWNESVGKSIVDNLTTNAGNSVKSGVNATSSNSGVPAKANVISKLANLVTSIPTEYLMGSVMVLNGDIFAVLLDALSTTNPGGFEYDPTSDRLFFPGGYPIIPTSHIGTAAKTTDSIAVFGNLRYSTVLGLRRNLEIDLVNSTDDPGQINWLSRTRYAVAKQDTEAVSKMLASA